MANFVWHKLESNLPAIIQLPGILFLVNTATSSTAAIEPRQINSKHDRTFENSTAPFDVRKLTERMAGNKRQFHTS